MPRITKPKKRWFKMDADPDGGSIELRVLTPGEKNEVKSAMFKQKIVYLPDDDGKIVKTEQQMQQTPQEATELTAKFAIVGWENFYGEDGSLIECNKENVVMAIRSIEGLSEFVASSMKRLVDDIAKEKVVQEKN